MLRRILKLIVVGSLSFAAVTHAEIYKRIDAEGRITYSNVQTKDSVRLKIGRDAPERRTTSTKTQKNHKATIKAANLKRQYRSQISHNTQSKRDATRREILLDELDTEKKAVVAAQEAYDMGKRNPEVVRRRNADGTVATFRNVPKYREKMERLTAALQMHQRNVELLKKEISALN